MSKNIKNIVKNNLNSLLETKGFEHMEVAFGVKEKSDNLSDAEKKQFGEWETIQDEEGVKLGDASVQPALNKVHKEDEKDADTYYKEVDKKMKDFQKTSESKPSQIGEAKITDDGLTRDTDLYNIDESFTPPKVNREDDQTEPDEVYSTEALGPGMLALKYDNEGTPVHKKFEERMEDMNGDDLTYKKLRAYSEKYLKHKYEKPSEYHKTPKVRVTNESISMDDEKERAWKKFQKDKHVTSKTIKVARRDFEKEYAKKDSVDGTKKSTYNEGKEIIKTKQNGDKSYSVEYSDGTRKKIHVSHDDWDEVHGKYGKIETNDLASLRGQKNVKGFVSELNLTGTDDRYRADEYDSAVEYAQAISWKYRVIQHVNELPNDPKYKYEVTDKPDGDNTKISFKNGEQIDFSTLRTSKNVSEIKEYSDVLKENIFKVKNTIKSKEQVLKLVSKLPKRVRVDETEFAVTDGENYYKLLWEGMEDGEAVIINEMNRKVVNEDISKMKHLWGFKSSDSISTKKNIKEGNEDVFFKMMNKVRKK